MSREDHEIDSMVYTEGDEGPCNEAVVTVDDEVTSPGCSRRRLEDFDPWVPPQDRPC